MSEVPQLEKEEAEQKVVFATEDESTGMVLIGWRGPNVSVGHFMKHFNAFRLLVERQPMYQQRPPLPGIIETLVEIKLLIFYLLPICFFVYVNHLLH